MYGPLSVGTIYGPLAITQNPALAPASGPILNVLGGTFMDNLTVLNELSVDGVGIGPVALQRLTAHIAAATVTIVNLIDSTDVRLGAVVGDTLIVTVYDIGSPYIPYSFPQTVNVTVQLPQGGNYKVSANVTYTMPSLNLALLETQGHSFTGASILGIAGVDADSPAEGTSVFVSTAVADTTPSIGQQARVQAAVVSNAFVQAYDYYTSHSIAATSLIPTSTAPILFGNPVVDAAHRLISLRQGNYCIKARYIALFLLLAETTSPFNAIPYAYAAPLGTTPARSIGLVERAAASGLNSGGVSGAPVGTTTTPGTQVAAIEIDGVVTQLGAVGQNNPSWTDTLVAAQLAGVDITTATLGVRRASAPLTPATISNISTNAALWNNGIPSNLSSQFGPSSAPKQVSTNFIFDNAQVYDVLTYPVVYNDSMSSSPTFWAAMHGNLSDGNQGHTQVMVGWGDGSAVSDFFLGLGGYVGKGFQAANVPLVGKVLVLGITYLTSGSQQCQFTYASSIPSNFTINISKTSTQISASVGGLSYVNQPISSTWPALNAYSITTSSPTASSTFPASVGLTVSTLQYGYLTPSTVSAATSISPPTAL
jgi:hypothetical protein